ncbi:TetR/AcrR family transcriptional regulator [Brevibacterium luteolum]|uniref:TetR/AcrR family transcriptional regulator n=1 Tax=Brevibacterium luteolum TaxID=199591 RepID=A0A6G8KUR0_9MICO|nr:TetR/AcrR family transcriptional regulator [Brevibacterium luteolum]QIN28518.1 TetR/AcrR family transcriptional regulator [Brevibacterium luteolum]
MAARTGRSAATRETILLAAASEFARAGYGGATHESILKVLGKSSPNYITYHYKTKADLADVVLARQDELWNDYIQTLANEGATGAEALVAVFFMMLHDEHNLPIFQAAVVLDSDRAAPRTGEFQPCAAWLRLVTERLHEARTAQQMPESVDVEEEAWMIVSTLYGIYQLGQQLDTAAELAPRFERAWHQLLGGLGISGTSELIEAAKARAENSLTVLTKATSD